MTDNTEFEELQGGFGRAFEELTESYAEAVERNVDAQAALLESWAEAVEGGVDDEELSEGVEGTMAAYEVWMDAAEESLERMADAVEGESVEPEELRDVWLGAANRAFKETMSTSAFAAASGGATDAALDLRREFDEAAEETLSSYGFATRGDVREVGERLVELERRQHAVEEKLDRLLAAHEDDEGNGGDGGDGTEGT